VEVLGESGEKKKKNVRGEIFKDSEEMKLRVRIL